MHRAFAPMTPVHVEDAKILFTGRTNELNNIFDLLGSHNNIGLFGERKSGKTFTLLIIEDIVSGKINRYERRLVDKIFAGQISEWKSRFQKYKSVYLSLEGTRDEQSLIRGLSRVLKANGICKNEVKDKAKGDIPYLLDDFLDSVHTELLQQQIKLIILLDEMESLEDYRNPGETLEDKSSAPTMVAEKLCNRIRYPNFLFIYAGSYTWKARFSAPGSLFRDLNRIYIGRVDKDALIQYLLLPLYDSELKNTIIDMSGCKPLYVQVLGKMAIEQNPPSLPNDINLIFEPIKINIFKERSLQNSEIALKIFDILTYYPNSTQSQMCRNIECRDSDIREQLSTFVNFHTITETSCKNWFSEEKQYRITGKLIEKYGRNLCTKPYGSSRNFISAFCAPHIFQWFLGTIFVLAACLSYGYFNPGTEAYNFTFQQVEIFTELPASVEDSESGEANIYIRNISTSTLNLVKLQFISEDILYTDSDGNSYLIFDELQPNDGQLQQINYTVRSTNASKMESQIVISGENKSVLWTVSRRFIAIQKYSPIFSIIIATLGLLIPGKQWGTLLTTLLNYMNPKNQS